MNKPNVGWISAAHPPNHVWNPRGCAALIHPTCIERDDLEMAPFDSQGGLGKMFQLFGADMDSLIDEMNEELAA
ncbi:MAG: hypothetical protein JMN25_10855 [gamma proteobacterium endosymbiont of Lamellibrachia anaximandri]|nr:hypothetical protein [gamma proteobacterium endosymbiont of Lamellibrachia anaximandri]